VITQSGLELLFWTANRLLLERSRCAVLTESGDYLVGIHSGAQARRPAHIDLYQLGA